MRVDTRIWKSSDSPPMAFTFSDFNDLKQLLAANPELRVELRNYLLDEDFRTLPAIVRELAEAQRRTEQRLEVLTERVNELAEAQRRTEQRLDVLTERVSELAEAQRRTDERFAEMVEAQRHTDQRLAELAEAQRHTEQRMAELAESQRRFEVSMDRFEVKLGRLQGDSLEIRYRLNAAAIFGRWLRRTEVVGGNELVDRAEGQLTPDDLDELLLTDLVVRGRVARRPSRPEVWLAVEISAVVDREDVARAVRRAELLRLAGLPGVPVVAGEGATEGGWDDARACGVALLQDGTARFWDDALAAWVV